MPKKHVVKQGDTLLSIAHLNKVLDWKRIWEHGDNASLRDKRKHPQVLSPGDVVTIPDDQPKEVTVPTGDNKKFVLKKLPSFFTVFLKDECGEPYASMKYKLKVGPLTFEGQTDAKGKVSHPVPPDVRVGELTLFAKPDDDKDKMVWKLDIGALNPADAVSGVKARLRNLGYDVGGLDDTLDTTTKNALKSFRQHLGLDSTKHDIDDSVRDALVKLQNLF